MTTIYRIMAHRGAASVFGAATAVAQHLGKPAEFPTREEAEAVVKAWADNRSPQTHVWNTIEEVETAEPESILAKLYRDLGRPATQAEIDAIIGLAKAKRDSR